MKTLLPPSTLKHLQFLLGRLNAVGAVLGGNLPPAWRIVEVYGVQIITDEDYGLVQISVDGTIRGTPLYTVTFAAPEGGAAHDAPAPAITEWHSLAATTAIQTALHALYGVKIMAAAYIAERNRVRNLRASALPDDFWTDGSSIGSKTAGRSING
jgi:hypothetical protein